MPEHRMYLLGEQEEMKAVGAKTLDETSQSRAVLGRRDGVVVRLRLARL
jgi:hypothetical protein